MITTIDETSRMLLEERLIEEREGKMRTRRGINSLTVARKLAEHFGYHIPENRELMRMLMRTSACIERGRELPEDLRQESDAYLVIRRNPQYCAAYLLSLEHKGTDYDYSGAPPEIFPVSAKISLRKK
jgi:hypothetical protein